MRFVGPRDEDTSGSRFEDQVDQLFDLDEDNRRDEEEDRGED
jgi:hypothetical protein